MKKVPCTIYSRVVGYYSPVSNWNYGKKEEFQNRKVYHAEDSLRRSIIRDIIHEGVVAHVSFRDLHPEI